MRAPKPCSPGGGAIDPAQTRSATRTKAGHRPRSVALQLASLAFLFLTPLLLTAAAQSGIEARLISPALVEVLPGQVATASVILVNWNESPEEFTDRILLPAGWTRISPPDVPFIIDGRSELVRVIALAIPTAAPAGRYELRYQVESRRDGSRIDEFSFAIVVRPLARLDLMLEEKPELVVAGEEIEIGFRLVNRSNGTVQVKLTADSSSGSAVRLDPAEMTLAPASSQTVRAWVRTDGSIQRVTRLVLALQASATLEAGSRPISVRQSTAVDVWPAVTGIDDPYVRVPARLRLTAASDDERGGGFQAEISGAGYLDETRQRSIDFIFQGPNLQPKTSQGLRDEYRISYFDGVFDAHIGDQSFSLSPLTKRFGFGRGVALNVHPGATAGGAFYMQNRWRPGDEDVGAYIRHRFNSLVSLQGNFLHREAPFRRLEEPSASAQLYSLQPRFRFGNLLNLTAEYGASQSGQGPGGEAYRVEMRGEAAENVFYTLERVHADSKFRGYYSDTDATHADVTFPILAQLRGSVSFRQFAGNLEENPELEATANRETSLRPGIRYTFASGASVGLEYQNTRRRDAIEPARHDFREHSARLTLGHRIGPVSLQTSMEQGAVENRLTQREEHVERYGAYAYYRPSPSQSYSAFATLGTEYLAASPGRTESVGVGGTWKIGSAFSANTHYVRSRRERSKAESVRDQATAGISYTSANRHEVALRARWSNDHTTDQSETMVMVTYTVPFGIPVGRRTSTGALEGHVYEERDGIEVPLSRVVLTLNGTTTAATDREGKFVFPSLDPGIYRLYVEQRSLGPEFVTTEPLPLTIEIKKGERASINLAIVRSAQLSARVAIFAPTNRNLTLDASVSQEDSFEEVTGLAACLIEVSNGRETFRQMAGRDGELAFNNLRPGRWTLRVYDHSLPEHHFLERREFEVQLGPGDSRETLVRVLPRHRPIQFIDQGRISLRSE